MKSPILWGAYMFTPLYVRGLTKAAEEALIALKGSDPEGMPWSYTEIAKRVGLSRERVRQLAKKHLGETGRQRWALIAKMRATQRRYYFSSKGQANEKRKLQARWELAT